MHWFVTVLMMAAPPAGGDLGTATPAASPRQGEQGPFQALLRSSEFAGPGVLSAAGQAEGQMAIMPGDFQRHSGLAVVADRLAADFPETLAAVVASVRQKTSVFGLYSSDEGRDTIVRLLAGKGLPGDALRLVRASSNTIWIRDFGPAFVAGPGATIALDFEYVRKSGAQRRERDDAIASLLAAGLGIPIKRVPLVLECGNLLSNGQGIVLTTTETFNANIARGRTRDAVLGELRRSLGFRQVVVLEPLAGEPTGHADVFACWTDPETVVLGRYDAPADPFNAPILERNAAVLAKVRTEQGKPLRVVRIAMPSNEGGVWRTYANSVLANGVLLAPRYRDKDAGQEAAAHAVFRQLLPGRQIVPIPSESLVARGGGLRCVTLHVP